MKPGSLIDAHMIVLSSQIVKPIPTVPSPRHEALSDPANTGHLLCSEVDLSAAGLP